MKRRTDPEHTRLVPWVVVIVLVSLGSVPARADPAFGLGLEKLFPRLDTDPVARIHPAAVDLEPARTDINIVYSPPTDGDRPRPFPARLPGDTAAMFKAPLAWEARDWRRLGLGVAAVGAVALLDARVDGWLDLHRSNTAVEVANAIRPLGKEGALVLLGATWLAGHHFDRPELTAVAIDGFESAILAAGVITPILKTISGRARPRNTTDNGAFGRSGASFPSGETTLAFSIASVVAAHSDRGWIDGLAWSVAGLVGVQRMVLDAHWATDVIAGALVGTVVGQWVVRRNRPERESGPRLSFSPMIDFESYGVVVRLRF